MRYQNRGKHHANVAPKCFGQRQRPRGEAAGGIIGHHEHEQTGRPYSHQELRSRCRNLQVTELAQRHAVVRIDEHTQHA